MKPHIAIAQVAGSILLASITAHAPIQAQIVPDTTLPVNSSVQSPGTADCPGICIRGGTQVENVNLFHSFEAFNVGTVPDSATVTFFDPGVINIISRVTGNAESRILGRLGTSTNSAANLFLINPNGIIFGRDASLDLRGSFIASTASSLNFADGTQFTVTPTQTTSLLTISIPIGLQFGSAPKAISVQGRDGQLSNLTGRGLRVQQGKTLALVGGNITFNGGLLTSSDGRVELGGIAEPGIVGLSDSSGSLHLDFPTNVEWADISLIRGAWIGGTDGSTVSIKANVLSLDGSSINSTSNQGNSGSVDINAKSVFLRNRASIDSTNSGSRQAGNVYIHAHDNVSIESDSVISSQTTGQGNGGNITVEAGSMYIIDSRLNSDTNGSGNAGKISLTAQDDILIANGSIDSSAGVRVGDVVGDANNIEISAGSLSLTNGANLFTANTGEKKTGDVIINTRDRVLLNKSYIYTPIPDTDNPAPNMGVSGNINITTKSFSSIDSVLDVATFGKQGAGSVTIKASESATISRVNPDLEALKNINLPTPGIYTSTTAGGNAGGLTIETGELKILGGARVTASTSGSGNGGALTVTASSIELSGASEHSPSGLFTETRGTGAAGNLIVNTQELTVKDGATISASTITTISASAIKDDATGNSFIFTGKPGSIFVRGRDPFSPSDSVSLSNGSISTAVNAGTVVDSSGESRGNIDIQTRNLSLTNHAKVTASTSGKGDAGIITVWNAESVSLDNGSLISTAVNSGAIGQGGNVDIQTNALTLANGAQVTASTKGQGIAGDIVVNAGNGSVSLSDPSSGLFTNTESNTGRGGAIAVTTNTFQISNNAELNATTNSASSGGSITVNANTLNASSGGKLSTSTSGTGAAGNVVVNAQELTVEDGATISASTIKTISAPAVKDDATGDSFIFTGKPGSIFVRGRDFVSPSDSVSLSNGGSISTTVTEGTVMIAPPGEQRGNIDIQTRNLSLINHAQVTASTSGKGDAGIITVRNAESVSLDNGSSISTAVNSRAIGQGGDINIQSRAITLSGAGTGILANTEQNSSGRGGNISINPGTRTVTIQDGAVIGVNSQGNGEGGSIILSADILKLDNKGQISAATANNQGGNITLNLQDFLFLRDGSNISASAGQIQGDGNGGNVVINIPTGFIFAFPEENSDITANAVRGRGGNVEITALGIFGIVFREELTPLSDITASSEFNAQGSVTLNTLGIDPSRGLAELPNTLADASKLIAQECTPGGKQTRNSFVVTGQGGLPPNPAGVLGGETVITRLATVENEQTDRSLPTLPTPTPRTSAAIVEAQGWVVDSNGDIWLVAESPENAGTPWTAAIPCQPRQ